MGIQGLTSFVNHNYHHCMKKIELHDTELVIDGDSTAYQLYSNHFSPKHCCFSGDYDRYGELIRFFFQLLVKCNIKPVIIFDGGYDDRKIFTIERRMRDRTTIGIKLDATSKNVLFPLFLGQLFKEIAEEFKFSVIRCDYEGDLESANMAKALNCPVLSNDSDFYIFDVLYIPFSSVRMQVITNTVQSKEYSYIACDLFVTEKFLNFLKLTKDKLPLFATLLGNDYMDKINLTQLFGGNFHNNLNRGFGHYNKGSQYIKMLALWLRNERDLLTAIDKVLQLCRLSEKDQTKKNIQDTIEGYICKSTTYLLYLKSRGTVNNLVMHNESDNEFMKVFLNNSRKALYPSCFINMLNQNTYYVRPQVEDDSLPSCHIASINIISAIHKILKNSNLQLRLFCRIGHDLQEQLLTNYSDPIPKFLDIQNLDLEERKEIIHKILGVDEQFKNNTLDYFHDTWKLYLISLNYLSNKSGLNWSIVYSIVLCKVVIEFLDKKVGYFRQHKKFHEKFNKEICKILLNKSNLDQENLLQGSLFSAIGNISYEDCLIAQKNLISYFEMKLELKKNPRLFQRKIVHAASQFQSCFYHIGFLNNLLNSPYRMSSISECFNGTFIYNMTNDLREKGDKYIDFLLQNSPSVLSCFNHMIVCLKSSIDIPFLPTNQGFNV